MSMTMITFDAQWVTIANRALLRIGSDQISSLDDGSVGANFCSQLLPQALETCYSSYHWRSAAKRAQLVPLAIAPAYGFAYQYILPRDFALIRTVQCDGAYEIEGMRILSDSTAMSISYVAIPSTPSEMAPILRDLVVRQLSYLISIPMLKNDTISNRLSQEYMQAYAMAVQKDSIALDEEDTSIGWYDDNR